MGMFDYLQCEWPLPLPEFQDRMFQTKDLGCNLDLYTIRSNGQLVVQRFDAFEDFDERDLPKKKMHEYPFFGAVNFYCYMVEDPPKAPDGVRYHGRVEFAALFDDKLLKIKAIRNISPEDQYKIARTVAKIQEEVEE